MEFWPSITWKPVIDATGDPDTVELIIGGPTGLTRGVRTVLFDKRPAT